MKFDANKVRKLILLKGLSETEFASSIEMAHCQLSTILNRGTCLPFNLERLAQGLCVTIEDLLPDDLSKIKVMLDPGAITPTRAHEADAGLDLFAKEYDRIPPNGIASFDTGVHVAIPKGYVGLLTSKSGLMAEGITSRGTIDSGFQGSIKAVLFNHTNKYVHIEPGRKITQLVIMPIITPEVEIVDSLEETERGAGGFGSTGKF